MHQTATVPGELAEPLVLASPAQSQVSVVPQAWPGQQPSAHGFDGPPQHTPETHSPPGQSAGWVQLPPPQTPRSDVLLTRRHVNPAQQRPGPEPGRPVSQPPPQPLQVPEI